MKTEKLTIKASELKNKDTICAVGMFQSSYPSSPVNNVLYDSWADLVKFSLGNSVMHLSSHWYLEVEREVEKLAQYYFKNHSMKEYALKEDSDLFRNASVVIHDGKVIKHPE